MMMEERRWRRFVMAAALCVSEFLSRTARWVHRAIRLKMFSGCSESSEAVLHKRKEERREEVEDENARLRRSIFNIPTEQELEKQRIERLQKVTEMIEKGLSTEEVGQELVRMNCKLNEVVELHDSLITKAYLEYCSEEDVMVRVHPKMLDYDLQHIRVLFDNGPERDSRKGHFVEIVVMYICDFEKTQKGRDFLQTIADQRLFDEVCFDRMEFLLKSEFRRTVEVIFKYDFHKIAKDMYDRDIIVGLFANRHKNISSLLKTGKHAVDVDERYANGNSPLHYAAEYLMKIDIRWMLDRGADPNASNNEQHTPLSLALKNYDFYASVSCIKLLLLATGNLVSVSHLFEDGTFFGFRLEDSIDEESYYRQFFQLLIAQLCIDEAATVNADILQSIERLFKVFVGQQNHEFRQFLDKCRQQLKPLKKHEVCDSRHRETHRTKVTIFSVIAEKPEIVARYVSEEQLQTIGMFMLTSKAHSLNIYYRQLLEQRFEDIAIICRGRNRAIDIVCQLTGIRDTNHLVVHKIVSYLNNRDFQHFNAHANRRTNSF